MKMGLKKIHLFLQAWTLSACLILVSCTPQGGAGDREVADDENSQIGNGGTSGGGSQPSGPGATNGTGGSLNMETIEPTAELRHIIDPIDGTFKAKLTIPKNFKGLLFLSGLNITSLKDKLVHVRFNFGREREPITVPATIQSVGGLTPQTDIEVLALNFTSPLFQDLRLLYDLYDYNEYSTTAAEPTTDPTNTGLYCRGLRLEDDPTFQSSNADTLCNVAGERCLYAYAKVIDRGLVDTTTGFSIIPTEPNIALSTTDFSSPENATQRANNLKKCLYDNGVQLFNANAGDPYLDINQATAVGLGVDAHISNGTTYRYQGPYRPISETSWEISGGATIVDNIATGGEPTGLFMRSLDGTNEGGILSFLFPRSGKLSLKSNIEHLSSANPLGTIAANVFTADSRTRNTLIAAGDTAYMDGCNLRVANFDVNINEGIGSCNVTASIQIITIDQTTNQETIITSSKDLKLQIIRESLENFEGREVLYSSMKTCSSSNACGADECCYNSRCWSRDTVSQCIEDSVQLGNLSIGNSCTTDFECATLCCDESKRVCSVHDTVADPQVLCSKAPGGSCVAKEWCRKENVRQCFVVRTGIGSQGQTTCALRCYNVPTHGECRNGRCSEPISPAVPAFDPNNPDCSTAIDPPTTFDDN